MSAEYDYDLFVIGAGSGGVRAARIAASFGAKVGIAEDLYLGGTCVNVGCVPKKLFVYASHYHEDFQDARGFGWNTGADATFDWATLRDNKTNEIKRLNGIYNNILENAGVEIVHGKASLKDRHTLQVGDKTVTAETILVAVGGWPFVPDFPGNEHVISSNEVFYLDEFPKRALVVGGGYIAVEFAGIFNGLGAQTTQLYRGDLFLRGFDQDVREFIADEMRNKGVDLRFNLNIEKVEKLDDGSLRAYLTDGSTLDADTILYATGRKPKTEGIGLEEVGVALRDNGQIIVDERFQTSVDNIYALGDVTGGMELTPVALEEGMNFARRLYNNQDKLLDYNHIATAVFCQPNIGTVGMSEAEARKSHDVVIFKSSFKPMKHTISGRNERSLMKLIVDKNTDKVLGVHMVGPDAGEIIQGIAIALKAGATKQVFDETIGIHPTAAEEFVTMREPVSA